MSLVERIENFKKIGFTDQDLDGIPHEDLLKGLASFENLGGSTELLKRAQPTESDTLGVENRQARAWDYDTAEVRVTVTNRVNAQFHLYAGTNFRTAPNPITLTGVGSNGGRPERIDGVLDYISQAQLQAASNTVVLQSTADGVFAEFSINSRVIGRFRSNGRRILARFSGSGVCTWN